MISGLGGQANANYGVAQDYVNEAGNNLELFGSIAGAAAGTFAGNPAAATGGLQSFGAGGGGGSSSGFGTFGGSTAGGLTPPGGYGFQSSGQTPASFGAPSGNSSYSFQNSGRIPNSF